MSNETSPSRKGGLWTAQPSGAAVLILTVLALAACDGGNTIPPTTASTAPQMTTLANDEVIDCGPKEGGKRKVFETVAQIKDAFAHNICVSGADSMNVEKKFNLADPELWDMVSPKGGHAGECGDYYDKTCEDFHRRPDGTLYVHDHAAAARAQAKIHAHEVAEDARDANAPAPLSTEDKHPTAEQHLARHDPHVHDHMSLKALTLECEDGNRHLPEIMQRVSDGTLDRMEAYKMTVDVSDACSKAEEKIRP